MADPTHLEPFSEATIAIVSSDSNEPLGPLPWVDADGRPIRITVALAVTELSLAADLVLEPQPSPEPIQSLIDFLPNPFPRLRDEAAPIDRMAAAPPRSRMTETSRSPRPSPLR